MMKKSILYAVIVSLGCALFALPAVAQYGSVKGVCKDAQGNPIADAQIVWQNQDNGRSYKLKTNKKGEFFSLGIDPGKYTVTLSKDGKVLDEQKNYQVGLGESEYNIDLKQIQQQGMEATAKKEGVSTEEIKRRQEEIEKVQQRNAGIKAVNEKLQAGIAMMNAQPPDYEKAIALLTEASQMAPNEDVVWADLGAAYLDSAQTQTDPAEKAKRNTAAYDALKKAIDLRKGMAAPPEGRAPGQPAASGQTQAAPAATAAKPLTPADVERLASYYGNLGSAAARLGKYDEAAAAFQQAAQTNPSKAAGYYYNLGIVLHNSAKDAEGKKQAAAAFDKAIAADPTKADAYYLKGTDLIALSTTDSSGKLSAPEGTAEAFQKYLELQPNGPHAEESKQMLAALGSTVETGFGNKKGAAKKH
jgi:tetratricopeptide (TPR) repeat protein